MDSGLGLRQTGEAGVCRFTRRASADHNPAQTSVHSFQAAVADAAPLMTDLKVFIVEDSPVIRENLVGALEELAPIQVVGLSLIHI